MINNWEPGLYLAPSPIGNLGDITFRILELLKVADLVLAEDTRRTLKLLNHFSLKKILISYREQNHNKVWPQIFKNLEAGGIVVLVTDAGAPSISDPGAYLVEEVLKNFKVFPLPGPSAVITALMASGFVADNFIFGGFLPNRSSLRKKYLEQFLNLNFTLVFFESPYRLLASMLDLYEMLGNRNILLAREMTKIYEEYWHGDIISLIDRLKISSVKGEITLVIEKNIIIEEKKELPLNELEGIIKNDKRKAKLLAKDLKKITNLTTSELYNLIIKIRVKS